MGACVSWEEGARVRQAGRPPSTSDGQQPELDSTGEAPVGDQDVLGGEVSLHLAGEETVGSQAGQWNRDGASPPHMPHRALGQDMGQLQDMGNLEDIGTVCERSQDEATHDGSEVVAPVGQEGERRVQLPPEATNHIVGLLQLELPSTHSKARDPLRNLPAFGHLRLVNKATKAIVERTQPAMVACLASRLSRIVIDRRTEIGELQLQSRPGSPLQQTTGLSLDCGPLLRALDVLLACTNLRRLQLRDCGLGVHMILDALRGKPIESLDLAGNRLGSQLVDWLAPLLSVGILRELDLSKNELDDSGGQGGGNWSTWEGHRLLSLNLSDNPLGNDSVLSIRRCFLEHGLEKLNISACDIFDAWPMSLGSNRTLTVLDASRNEFTDDGLAAFQLASNTTLQELDLSDCGLARLTDLGLKSNTTLRKLSLSRNPEITAPDLATLDLCRTGLEELDLSHTLVQNLDWLPLASNHTLHTVSLAGVGMRSCCQLGTKTSLKSLIAPISKLGGPHLWSGICEEFTANTTLRRLDLSVYLTDEVAVHLPLGENCGIEELILSHCGDKLTDYGILAMEVDEMAALKVLDIHDSVGISLYCAEELRRGGL